MKQRQIEDLQVHIAAMLGDAHYSDGLAILPAYLLKRLALLAGLKLKEDDYVALATANRSSEDKRL